MKSIKTQRVSMFMKMAFKSSPGNFSLATPRKSSMVLKSERFDRSMPSVKTCELNTDSWLTLISVNFSESGIPSFF